MLAHLWMNKERKNSHLLDHLRVHYSRDEFQARTKTVEKLATILIAGQLR